MDKICKNFWESQVVRITLIDTKSFFFMDVCIRVFLWSLSKRATTGVCYSLYPLKIADKLWCLLNQREFVLPKWKWNFLLICTIHHSWPYLYDIANKTWRKSYEHRIFLCKTNMKRCIMHQRTFYSGAASCPTVHFVTQALNFVHL